MVTRSSLVLVLLSVLLVFVWSMAGVSAGRPPLRAHPHMFEISTRPWLYELSVKYGQPIRKLADIPDVELRNLSSRGIDIVWFMGIWSIGQYGVNYDRTNGDLQKLYSSVLPGWTADDVIGSPYAVTTYNINPELGTAADLAALRDRLHALGMWLMVDFVPNHSAVDCPYTSSHPEYYVRSPKGTQPPYDPSKYMSSGIAYGGMGWGDPWWDTAQFNYWDNGLIQTRLGELLSVASQADAIRCDMSFLLLNDQIQQNWGSQLASWGYTRPADEFWRIAIAKVKAAVPGTLFLAEVYSPYQQTLIDLGFDFVYEKELYDKLGAGDVGGVVGYLQGSSQSYLNHGAHFVENHDEPPAVAFFGSWWRADGAALATFTLPGMRFHFQDQWWGVSNRLLVQLRRRASQQPVGDVQQMYDALLNITNDDVFHSGSWQMLSVQGSSTMMAWKWALADGSQKRLCVVNYGDASGGGSVVVPDAYARGGNDTIPVTDLLGGQTYYRSASGMRSQGLYVIVNPWWAQLFAY